MSFFSAFTELLKSAPPPDPEVGNALERVADLVDPLLKVAPHFEKALRQPIRHALDYCDALVRQLPGPVEISRHAFSRDPLVHALFATADDVREMLGRSHAVRDFLDSPDCWKSDHFHAMFVARRQRKKQWGMALSGEVIRTDVAQEIVYFCDQTLVEPDCRLERSRERLRSRTLDSLLLTFRAHVEALRQERDGLRADVAAERAHMTVLRGRSPAREYHVHTRRLQELDEHLRRLADSLMPDHLLAALADFLLAPQEALRLTPVSITVDRLGVVRDEPDGNGDVYTLNFPELTARDRRQHLAMMARISRDEAIAAVERVRDEQHRFMLI